MILQKCAWANIKTIVAYSRHRHRHRYIYIYIYTHILGLFQGWRETKWMVAFVSKQREKKIKKVKKNDISMK